MVVAGVVGAGVVEFVFGVVVLGAAVAGGVVLVAGVLVVGGKVVLTEEAFTPGGASIPLDMSNFSLNSIQPLPLLIFDDAVR